MKVLSNVSCNLVFWKSPVDVMIGHYDNNRLAIYLESSSDGEPAATCTVNMVDDPCPNDEVWIKDYESNEGMSEWLFSAGILADLGPRATTDAGHVYVSRYQLAPKFLEAIARRLARPFNEDDPSPESGRVGLGRLPPPAEDEPLQDDSRSEYDEARMEGLSIRKEKS